MKIFFTLSIAVLSLLATSAHAREACNTIKECQELKIKVDASLAELLNDLRNNLTGVLKKGVNQYRAEEICAEQNMRLPTARELALASQSLKAKGISEKAKDFYKLVKGSDSAGNPDHFYYKPKGYRPPAGDLGNNWFWTSSGFPDSDIDSAYVHMGHSGDIRPYGRDTDASYFAVRCMQSHATSVHAGGVCNTIKECQELKIKVDFRLAELLKDVMPDLTGILEKGVNQYQAEEICAEQNMRLPTARELALVAQRSQGAEGISETAKDGYYLVRGSDHAGNPDHFYFSHKGYKRPAGDFGVYFFWSSSVYPDSYDDGAFRLDGSEGSVEYVWRTVQFSLYAVRCVRPW